MAIQRVKVTGLKNFQSQIVKEIRKILRDKTTRQSVGRIVVAGIRSSSFGEPSNVTMQFRKFFEQYNKTHPEYRRSNINITFTGELLNDLQKNVKADFGGGKNEYIIEHSGKLHKGYDSGEARKKGKRKIEVTSLKSKKTRETRQKYSRQRISYQMISEYLIEKGYDYLQLNDATINRVLRYINIRLKGQLVKKFK